jgi:hypothetical protein
MEYHPGVKILTAKSLPILTVWVVNFSVQERHLLTLAFIKGIGLEVTINGALNVEGILASRGWKFRSHAWSPLREYNHNDNLECVKLL